MYKLLESKVKSFARMDVALDWLGSMAVSDTLFTVPSPQSLQRSIYRTYMYCVEDGSIAVVGREFEVLKGKGN